jgi:hypothetical protein
MSRLKPFPKPVTWNAHIVIDGQKKAYLGDVTAETRQIALEAASRAFKNVKPNELTVERQKR